MTISDAQMRHQTILDAAIKLSERYGYKNVKRSDIATAAEVGEGTVSWHFQGMKNLRDEIVRAAISRKNIKIVAQALVDGHRFAKSAPLELRQKAGQLIAS